MGHCFLRVVNSNADFFCVFFETAMLRCEILHIIMLSSRYSRKTDHVLIFIRPMLLYACDSTSGVF